MRAFPFSRIRPFGIAVGIAGCLALLDAPEASAHPVSFKGGSQLMIEGAEDMQMLEWYYSYNARRALGLHAARFDFGENGEGAEFATFLQHNWLLHRWNLPEAQANLYAGLGLGGARSDAGDDPAALVFGRYDYETRRVYTALESTLYASEAFTHAVSVAAAGVAPYKAEFDDLNTWLLFKVEHVTDRPDEWAFIPELRFFWRNYFLEIGVSTDGHFRARFMIHF